MELTSSAFRDGDSIPERFTCEGEGISPPLQWEGVPEETKSLALVLDDPDANSLFTHWLIYNLPVIPAQLLEGASLSRQISGGLKEGLNSFGNQGYSPPCPPRGEKAHRYIFRLFALSEELNFPGRVTRDKLMNGIEGIVIDESNLTGTFSR